MRGSEIGIFAIATLGYILIAEKVTVSGTLLFALGVTIGVSIGNYIVRKYL